MLLLFAYRILQLCDLQHLFSVGGFQPFYRIVMLLPALLQSFTHLSASTLHELVFFLDLLHLQAHLLLLSAVQVDYFVEVHDLLVHLSQLICVLHFQPVNVA